MRIFLTDGQKIWLTKEVESNIDLDNENTIAEEATDGNLFWVKEEDYR